jgi:hypothetical protein
MRGRITRNPLRESSAIPAFTTARLTCIDAARSRSGGSCVPTGKRPESIIDSNSRTNSSFSVGALILENSIRLRPPVTGSTKYHGIYYIILFLKSNANMAENGEIYGVISITVDIV